MGKNKKNQKEIEKKEKIEKKEDFRNKNSFLNVKIMKSKLKNIKHLKLYIGIIIIIFLIFLIGLSFLIIEHHRFNELNDFRDDVYLTQYDPNNIFVKPKTLTKMKYDINQQIQKIYNVYTKDVSTSKENIEKVKKIYENSDISFKEKEKKIYTIIYNDLITRLEEQAKEINEEENENLKYNTKENEQKNLILEKLKKLNFEGQKNLVNLYAILCNYEKINQKYEILNNDTSERIQKAAEKKKIEEEKKAEEAKKAEEVKKAEEENDSYNSGTVNMDGIYDRGNAQALFNAINSYRASLGLKPYSYNNTEQSCVDSEAVTYSNTNTPHNWVCKAADDEDASFTSSGSDLVGITMNFFINDPLHEAPMSGTYNSIAISVVVKNGMNYTIVDFFN